MNVKAPDNDESTSLVALFDALHFHPAIVEASRSLYKGGHYYNAIQNAFIRVEMEVRTVSNLHDQIGQGLMGNAFTGEDPRIQLNPMVSKSDRDEQKGLKFIFMGSMTGIRNPKAHYLISQNDPYKTLEYIALASLLLKRIDERIQN